ncbi:MAG: DUF2829 domain-containing protein [Liquorilactobacillus nagelii]|jgi:hypothetical protein|uniref:Thoeris anti-defense 2-like domain-containing protein n=1 Tax=Liquorilactobacillus nagelii TaxID=82688 RepID=A0A3Q8CU28_9LACO|nr:DUF2829 domain-containing protein [Liquorilactobacillus nagelii]AUJ31230.1 hypothetical protein BSQ50_00775 [Liquorilactobacillus nagelii]KRL40258.1 hypothetical protein FD45_GL002365 [Liquorilactobacillus nagelii DSM 13675]MCC7616210.1 DUF2829 domain-containing protein [Liquorilactobacillus nagelii]MCI1699151.1 DUF2829 domain-containing protein [Liquorilactobacillus nagelii]MCP9314965.1 DUF2829 domain-containing protein [Liquorilactobacillus nagelii]
MKFEQALPLLRQGKKLIRQSWQSGEKYIFLVDQPKHAGQAVNPYFLIKTAEIPALSMFQPTSCDLLAEDWLEVEG